MRKRTRFRSWGGVGALLALGLLAGAVPLALAKGPPEQATIAGTGISQSLEVTDPRLMEAIGSLQDFERGAQAPLWVDEFYVITRSFRDGGELLPFDQVLYAPDPEGGPGRVYYVGIHDGWGPHDGKWFQAVPENEAVLQALLAARPDAVVAAPPQVDQAPSGLGLLPAGAVGALAGAGGMVGVLAFRSSRQGPANGKRREDL